MCDMASTLDETKKNFIDNTINYLQLNCLDSIKGIATMFGGEGVAGVAGGITREPGISLTKKSMQIQESLAKEKNSTLDFNSRLNALKNICSAIIAYINFCQTHPETKIFSKWMEVMATTKTNVESVIRNINSQLIPQKVAEMQTRMQTRISLLNKIISN